MNVQSHCLLVVIACAAQLTWAGEPRTNYRTAPLDGGGVRLIAADRSGTNAWGPETNGLQMSISLKGGEKQLNRNQGIRLLIRLRSLSTSDTFDFYLQGEHERSSAFSFQVISPSGKDVSPRVPENMRWSGGTVPVYPGRITEVDFNLSRFGTFDELGTYTVLGRCFLDHLVDLPLGRVKMVQVVSNPLEVSIVSGD
jgi:hypothetical protein